MFFFSVIWSWQNHLRMRYHLCEPLQAGKLLWQHFPLFHVNYCSLWNELLEKEGACHIHVCDAPWQNPNPLAHRDLQSQHFPLTQQEECRVPPGASHTPSALRTPGRAGVEKLRKRSATESPTTAGCLIGKAQSETVTNLMSRIKTLAFCAVLCAEILTQVH